MYTYDDRFFATADQTAAMSAAGVIPHLADLQVRSILDIGCGQGVWLAQWAKHGATELIGVDGPYVDVKKLHIPSSAFMPRDVGEPFALDRRFDLVQSLEVAEHLPENKADIFIDNLVRHGRLVLFSAAVPGQGGEHHVNEQPLDYWRAKFAARGYEPIDFLRPRIRDNKEIYFCYRYNTVLYAESSLIPSLPAAIGASRVPSGQSLESGVPLALRARFAVVRHLPRPLVDLIAKLRYAAIGSLGRARPAITSFVDRAARSWPLERLRRTPLSRWIATAANKTNPMLERIPPRNWSSLIIGCMCALVIALVFAAGVKRGMHHVVAWGPESEQNAISIALSESIYGLNLGYVGHASVKARLQEVWNRGAKDANDPILVENNRNRMVLTDAIRAAASMGPQPVGFLSERSLFTMVYDDIGYVDYVKLSFQAFGKKIEAFYYMFFLLLGLSALAFLITFRDDLIAQIVAFCTLFAFYLELRTAIFFDGMPTFSGMRHCSTLALLPMWHFAFLIMRDRAPSVPVLLATLFQVAVLILAVRIRGSAVWALIFILSVTMVVAVLYWRRAWTLAPYRRFAPRVLWVPCLLVLGLVASAQYTRARLHPIYFTDDVMPYHGLWHSAYLGLHLMTPETSELLARHGGPDQIGYAAALRYLQEIHFIDSRPTAPNAPPAYVSPFTGSYKFALHDSIMRRVFFKEALSRPLETFVLYAYTKPRVIYYVVKEAFVRVPNSNWARWALGGGALVFSIIFLFGAGVATMDLGRILILATAAVLFSSLPNIWAYPGFHTISDLLVTLLTLLPLALGMGGIVGYRYLRKT